MSLAIPLAFSRRSAACFFRNSLPSSALLLRMSRVSSPVFGANRRPIPTPTPSPRKKFANPSLFMCFLLKLDGPIGLQPKKSGEPRFIHSILRSHFRHSDRQSPVHFVQRGILQKTSETGSGRAVRICGKVPERKGLLDRGSQIQAAHAGSESARRGCRDRSPEGRRISRRPAFCRRLCRC